MMGQLGRSELVGRTGAAQGRQDTELATSEPDRPERVVEAAVELGPEPDDTAGHRLGPRIELRTFATPLLDHPVDGIFSLRCGSAHDSLIFCLCRKLLHAAADRQ